ncbi:hypothetical protein RUM43_008366 [Polyplax serrata]|uniref:Uncharacterized protein n=1 Tax=Polyplax serrata TaxID=468196 RepID=A0AAN8P313_POLSC
MGKTSSIGRDKTQVLSRAMSQRQTNKFPRALPKSIQKGITAAQLLIFAFKKDG